SNLRLYYRPRTVFIMPRPFYSSKNGDWLVCQRTS
ncbi:unnamed protein product, partial [Callosobruchus maculatus]